MTEQTGSSNRRDWLYLSIFIVVVLLITSIPYVYAMVGAPADRHFMGVVFNIPDHYQYFSWMRESQTQFLVPNQLTPEDSTPLLFNFLWFTLGRIESLTGIDYRILYQVTRLIAGAFVMAATYWFASLVFTNRAKRWTAFLLGVLGAGLGWIWVVAKYVGKVEIVPPNSFDIYTSEPNTFFNILAFPHFAIAAGLIAVIFGLVLLGQKKQSMRYAWAAALVSLLLSVQHAYDMFIIYPVIGLYALFIWLRDRKFPMYLFKLGIVVVLISVWPALQAFYITQADDVWKGVLSQFDNAGAWTPNPLHLPILMGIGWLLSIWALKIRLPWRERDDTHLFLMAWFLAHFILIYIPLNFQIHLLSGWQIVIGVMATIGLYTRVLPWLRKRLSGMSPQRVALVATGILLILVIPANLYIFAWRTLDMKAAWQEMDQRVADNRYFIRDTEYDAYQFLETQVKGTDVVFSSLNTGEFVPALTGGRSFLGHWAQTLDFQNKRVLVAAFFNPATTDAQRQEMLDQYSVDYVYYGPEEAALGAYDPAEAPFLTEIYANDDVTIYAVEPGQAAN
ncbi:MAG: hypothetical protein H6672_00725 [Anaerolineaceae bacterium]|nr:hypothetical protein [Anaerolineaceae bacterium]